MDALKPYAKAIAAAITGGLVAGLTTAQNAILDGNLSTSDWITIAIAAIVGAATSGGIVYAVPNKPQD